MNTWRLMMGFAAATGLVLACSSDPEKSEDDSGDGGSATTTTTGNGGATTTTTTTTTTVASTTTGTTGCAGEADFLSCANCFCAEDQAGCGAFIDAQDEHLFCGETCETACSAYCATVASGTPDPDTIVAACDTCVDGIASGNPDIAAFQNTCLADSACASFLQKLQMCPAPQ